MTAQECDRFVYKNDTFGIIGVDGEGLFDPKNYGIAVVPISTFCWRGYYCVYQISNNSLYLQEVYLGLNKEDERLIQKSNGIKLFGITPYRYKYIKGEIVKIDISRNFNQTKKANCSWDFRCDNLSQLTDFTGGILIGLDSLGRTNTSIHTCTLAYELVFDAGELIESIDRTNNMSKLQNILNSKKLEFNNNQRWQEAEQYLEQYFIWNYNL